MASVSSISLTMEPSVELLIPSPKEERKSKGEANQVSLKCNIFSIREIDTVLQFFVVDFFLEAQFSNPKFAGKTAEEIDCARELEFTYINLISKEAEEFWTRKYDKCKCSGNTLTQKGGRYGVLQDEVQGKVCAEI